VQKKVVYFMGKIGKLIRGKRFYLAVAIVVFVCLVLLITRNIWFSSEPSSHLPGPSPVNNTVISPLIFGTNLDLFNANDQVLQSGTTQKMLQYMHTQIIRMPIRTSLTEDTEMKAAQAIQAVDATPLVVLQTVNGSNDLQENMRVVKDMTALFGSAATVYYEVGSEEDVQGISATAYTTAWNELVPQLKTLAPHALFVGPVTYRYDAAYLTAFLQQAQPRPDAISWHEYTCDASWTQKVCISSIDSWTQHISNARIVMTSTIGTRIPIMITEWNYAANAAPDDGKDNDNAFITNWTTKAIMTLANNNVFASMQYSCTNTATPLISVGNTLTTQGNVLRTLYEQFVRSRRVVVSVPSPSATHPSHPTLKASPAPQGSTPTPTVATTPSQSVAKGSQPVVPAGPPAAPAHPAPAPTNPPAPPPASTSNVLSFEDGGTDGWYSTGHVNQIFNTTAAAYNASHSLAINLKSTSSSDFPYVGLNALPSTPQAGQTLTGHVYVAGGSVAISAKLFVLDNNGGWYDPGLLTKLSANSWSTLNFTIPAVNGHVAQIGVQFYCTPNNVNSTVYLDAINWG
jgi:hypothetical protein